MLKQLLIRNFAIIEELDLYLKPGMTVFTGETGAGKSILIDALGLILGDRAESTIIRAGCERTEISASFDLSENSDVASILEEQAIAVDDNEIIIRRVISNDGRSRAFINSTPVPVNLLKTIGEYLIDIHGQHAHQSLTKRDAQRLLLDSYGGYDKELNLVRDSYTSWHELQEKIVQLSGETENHGAQLTLLRYQVQELETLAPETDEYESLSEEFKRLDNANRLIELTQQATQNVMEDEYSLHNKLANTIRDMQEAQQFDDSIANILELLEGAAIQLSEAGDELRLYLDKLDRDPERLQNVEQRLSDIHDMARKHNIQSQQLPGYFEQLQQKLYEMENSQHLLADLVKQKDECLQLYHQAAKKLHLCRVKTAKLISGKISQTLETLGMSGGQFVIAIEEQDDAQPGLHGNDQIEFLVSANPGQPPQPLRKVASGGELSRISLAIQVISNNEKVIPTLVFDEVDAGIGGGVAEIVGNLLHSLTVKHQVFCVTHLPQVASLGDQHLQVQKSSSKKTTYTQVAELDDSERIEEIARMLGGIKITEQSRKHAKEMLIH
ncbi:MAG: DNA repair protein RecN [Gammaproteobacteria bacterium]|jgi:DNA repair protein RecN (Recombination protein N)|nr:DNA repair protein RecN [Gammaproteobacteria bacterium]